MPPLRPSRHTARRNPRHLLQHHLLRHRAAQPAAASRLPAATRRPHRLPLERALPYPPHQQRAGLADHPSLPRPRRQSQHHPPLHPRRFRLPHRHPGQPLRLRLQAACRHPSRPNRHTHGATHSPSLHPHPPPLGRRYHPLYPAATPPSNSTSTPSPRATPPTCWQPCSTVSASTTTSSTSAAK